MNIIRNNNRGFIAIVIVLMISGILLAIISYSSLESATFFDQALRKEYRIMNYYYAHSCIDQAILIIAHDYFFETNEYMDFADLHCQILRVEKIGNIRNIYTVGNYMKANVYRSGEVRVMESGVEIMGIK